MMLLVTHYPALKTLHVACVLFSGALFSCRAMLRLADTAAANDAVLRYLSYTVDSVLLVAGVLLMLVVHQYPIADAWLTVKMLLLVLYIGSGIICLRIAASKGAALVWLAVALTLFTLMVGVARAHHPAGWFHLLQ